MFRVFTGDDRVTISELVKKELGSDYEVIDGANLDVKDVINICKGTSLFAVERKILVKDLTPMRGEKEESLERADFYEEFIKYVDTPHKIVIWETSAPTTRKSFKDFCKAAGVKVEKKTLEDKKTPKERALERQEMNKVFDIYNVALRDGEKAVKMLAEIQEKQDPYRFFGLLVSQALKKYEERLGAKEKRALVELSKVDMQMKSTTISPWLLLQAFLLQVSSL